MRKSALVLGPLSLLAACHSSAPTTPFEAPDPSQCAVYQWEPGDGQLGTWPSMEYLTEDASTATGYRFAITAEAYPALEDFGEHAKLAVEQLSTLDGFGVHGANYAQFSQTFDAAALPAPDGEAHAEDPAGIVVFDAEGAPRLWPVALSTAVDGSSGQSLLIATPMFPLPEMSRAAFFVTAGVARATVTGCASASLGMHERLAADDEAQAVEALVSLGVIADDSELVALQPYVTQSLYDESLAVAADIASRPDADFPLTLDEDCVPDGPTRHCVAALDVVDYRNDQGFVALDASGAAVRGATYTLDVHIWIPDANSGPAPVFLVGHGLGSDSTEHGSMVAAAAAAEGAVVVAIDAVAHGTHPTAEEGAAQLDTILNFFAVDLSGPSVDALRLRDNFRQSTFDKLQLTRALLANPDLDGDGVEDLDPAHLAYLGVSLGALMGPELLALSDAYEAGILSMGGGRVSDIVNDPESSFSKVKVLVLPRAIFRSEAGTAKLFALLQTALDRGDSATFAGHVTHARFDLAPEAPDLLMMTVIGDEVVPNAENYYLARAAGVGIVPPLLDPVPGLETLPSAPVQGNMAGGHTAGMLQFDIIQPHEGDEAVVAEHGNMTQSVQGLAAILEFARSKWDEGTARIIDPYASTGLAHPAD